MFIRPPLPFGSGLTAAQGLLRRSLLEAEALAGRIGGHGVGMAEHAAKVDEMGLRGGSLLQLHIAPFRYEIVNHH